MFATATPLLNADLLKPIIDSVTSNITTILPVGLAVMGAIVGVTLIPRIIYKFI